MLAGNSLASGRPINNDETITMDIMDNDVRKIIYIEDRDVDFFCF